MEMIGMESSLHLTKKLRSPTVKLYLHYDRLVSN